MTGVFAAWLAEFMRVPWLLPGALIAAIVWLITTIVIVRRADGLAMRALLFVTSGLYLLAMLAFLNPPLLLQSSGIATLITAGADSDQLDAIDTQTDAYVIDEAWTEPAVQAFVAARRAARDDAPLVRIALVDDVLNYQPDLARLRIIGHGLSRSAWNASAFDRAIDFAAPPIGAGIAGVDFPAKLPVGESLDVAVRTTSSVASSRYSVSLHADDERELARMPVDESGIARLSATGLAPGRHVLDIRLTDMQSGEIVERNPAAVEVVRPPVARLLMLQASPSFEWRAISRWATDSGAAVATRVWVSSERVRTRTTTGYDVDAADISPQTLARVDLVIADGAVFGLLSDAEQKLLMDPTHGAGLLVMIHDADDFAALPAALADGLTRRDAAEVIYRLPEMGLAVDSGLTREPLAFVDGTNVTLLNDDLGRAVVARTDALPHVAVSLLRDSYRLVGAGEGAVHARVWSRLTQALARPAETLSPVFEREFSRVGERLRVCLPRAVEIDGLQMRESTGTRNAVSLHESMWQPGMRCAWYWPMSPGWLRVSDSDGVSFGARYVYAASDWRLLRIIERSDATRLRANASPGADAQMSQARQVVMPRDWPMMALLLLALGAWLIQRLAIARRQA